MHSSWNGIAQGAVRFTNPYPNNYMVVTGLDLYGISQTSGSLNVMLDAENSSTGAPGSQLAALTSQTLGSSGWTHYNFTSFNINVGVGANADIYGVIDTITAQMPYDNSTDTTNRSWYQWSGPPWVQGEPAGGTNNLMLRLDYTQGAATPEPSTMALLLGLLVTCVPGAAIMRRRRRRGDHPQSSTSSPLSPEPTGSSE
jgi:hypothetical protein